MKKNNGGKMNDKDLNTYKRTNNLEQCLMSYLKNKYLNKPCCVSGLSGNFTKIIDNDLYDYEEDNYIILNNKYYNDFKKNTDKYIKYFNKQQKEFYFKHKDKLKYVDNREKQKYNMNLFKRYFGFEYNDKIKEKTKNLFFQASSDIRAVLKESTIEKGGLFNKTLIRDNFDKKTNELKENI